MSEDFSNIHAISGLARKKLLNERKKIIIVGASGWLGMATLELLKGINKELDNYVYCFGSKKRNLFLLDGTRVTQHPLSELSLLPENSADYLINFAFLTKDKIKVLPKEIFIKTNFKISDFVSKEALRINVMNIATISSGEVYSEDKSVVSDINISPYGFLKFQEEQMFSGLTKNGAKVIIPRLFNLSGPYSVNKEVYVFLSFIAQALSSDFINITSGQLIYRSYVGICDLLSTIFGSMSIMEEGEIKIYDTCGESVVEIGELALQVKDLVNKKAKIIRPEVDENMKPDKYIGSRSEYELLIKKLDIKERSLKHQVLNTAKYIKAAYQLK